MDEWEILKGFPTITAAQLHDAISYYHDYKERLKSLSKQTRMPITNTLLSKAATFRHHSKY